MADEADESRIEAIERLRAPEEMIEPELPPPPPPPPTRRIGSDRPRTAAAQPEMPSPPEEGYVGERSAMNGQQPTNTVPIADQIDARLATSFIGADMRLVMTRLREFEKHFPELVTITQALINTQSRIVQLEEAFNQGQKVLQQLSQQRALGEMQLDRHTRSTALDLAIKACPTDKTGDPDTIATLADAFHGYITAGTGTQ